MGDCAAVLERVLERTAPNTPARRLVDAARLRYLRPLQVAVTGRAGSGRDTLARALRERLAVSVIGHDEDREVVAEADLWCYLLAGNPRGEDLAAISLLPRARTVIVLGKADVLGDESSIAGRVRHCATELRRPVVAVSALWAVADVGAEEITFLQRMLAAGESVPSMSAHFTVPTGLGGDVATGVGEAVLRTRLLRRVDQWGLEVALCLLEETAERGDNTERIADRVNALLRRESGIENVRACIAERVADVRQHREAQLQRQLDRGAAAGIDRDYLETVLGEIAAEVSA